MRSLFHFHCAVFAQTCDWHCHCVILAVQPTSTGAVATCYANTNVNAVASASSTALTDADSGAPQYCDGMSSKLEHAEPTRATAPEAPSLHLSLTSASYTVDDMTALGSPNGNRLSPHELTYEIKLPKQQGWNTRVW